MPDRPVLLYDGTCSFCAWTVQFVLRHERKRTLHFAALQSAYGSEALARHPELRGVDSMIWLAPAASGGPQRAVVRSEAALQVARYLGGPWRLASLARVVPRPLRDAAYDLVAQHRHRLFGLAERCVIPPPAEQSRFFDWG